MTRKKRETKIILPGLFYDSEKWVKAEAYSNFQVFTDRVLAELLGVSKMRVQTWRTSGMIPFETKGNSFAVYDVNAVLKALQKQGYEINYTKKSLQL